MQNSVLLLGAAPPFHYLQPTGHRKGRDCRKTQSELRGGLQSSSPEAVWSQRTRGPQAPPHARPQWHTTSTERTSDGKNISVEGTTSSRAQRAPGRAGHQAFAGIPSLREDARCAHGFTEGSPESGVLGKCGRKPVPPVNCQGHFLSNERNAGVTI